MKYFTTFNVWYVWPSLKLISRQLKACYIHIRNFHIHIWCESQNLCTAGNYRLPRVSENELEHTFKLTSVIRHTINNIK